LSTKPDAPVRPRTARWRHHPVQTAAFAVLGLVVLAGCTTDNTPKAYNDIVRASFVAACTGDVPAVDGVTTTLASTTYCRCAYDVYANNVPYNNDDKDNRDNGRLKGYGGKVFVDLEAELKDDPNKINDDSVVPKSVRDQLAACPKTGENVGTTVPTAPGSTVGPVPGTQPNGSTPPGTTR
jgi:hypothetical protein